MNVWQAISSFLLGVLLFMFLTVAVFESEIRLLLKAKAAQINAQVVKPCKVPDTTCEKTSSTTNRNN